MTPARDDVVLRATSSIVAFVAVVGICIVLVADAALRGRWDVVLASLPASAFVIWGAAVLFARPALRLTESGVTIVNPCRTTDAPWGLIDDVTTRYQVVVEMKDGTRIRSWGAPSSARNPRAGSDERHTDSSGRVTASHAARVIDDARWRHQDAAPDEKIERAWHVRTLLLGSVLGATVLAQVSIALAG